MHFILHIRIFMHIIRPLLPILPALFVFPRLKLIIFENYLRYFIHCSCIFMNIAL